MGEKKIADLELKILGILWQLKEGGTVRQILENWPPASVPGYTTVLKKLQVMEEKGLVRHQPQGKTYTYFPMVSRREVSRGKIGDLITTIFGGDRLGLTAAFLEEADFTAGELEQVRKLIEEMKDE